MSRERHPNTSGSQSPRTSYEEDIPLGPAVLTISLLPVPHPPRCGLDDWLRGTDVEIWDLEYQYRTGLTRHDTPLSPVRARFRFLWDDLVTTASRMMFDPSWDTALSLATTGLCLVVTCGFVVASIIVVVMIGSTPYLLVAAGSYVFERVSPSKSVINSHRNLVPERQGEKWYYVDGGASTESEVRSILDELQALFRRPVKGIQGSKRDVLLDLWGTTVGGILPAPRYDANYGYESLCQNLLDTSIRRVVLVGHARGCLIISKWMDHLLADFPREVLRKVEIYTFGSAARRMASPDKPFGSLEHFANADDLTARLGMLSVTSRPGHVQSQHPRGPIPVTTSGCGGRLFVRTSAGGSGLLKHYLDPRYSILDNPMVLKHSSLASYLDGANYAGDDGYRDEH